MGRKTYRTPITLTLPADTGTTRMTPEALRAHIERCRSGAASPRPSRKQARTTTRSTRKVAALRDWA